MTQLTQKPCIIKAVKTQGFQEMNLKKPLAKKFEIKMM